MARDPINPSVVHHIQSQQGGGCLHASNESHHSAGTQGRIIIERKLQNLLSRSLGEPEKEEKEKEKEEEEVDCVVWTRISLNRPCFRPDNHQTRLRKQDKANEISATP